MTDDRRIAVIGGCGHVGLPLSLAFAAKQLDVTIVDVDEAAVARLSRGELPFHERGAQPLLDAHLGKNLRATTSNAPVRDADVVVCIVGTPVGKDHAPQVDPLRDVLAALVPWLRRGQLFVLRSTVFPGATERLGRWLVDRVPGLDVAYCPERIAQGHAIEEIEALPQIVSGLGEAATERARALFGRVARKTLVLSPAEAELAKLFCNTWRYVTFAVANELYGLCAAKGIDYARVRAAIVEDYPRAAGLPGAGFAAGPCLLKDTMQLVATQGHDFSLGQAALAVNEDFPRVLLKQLQPLRLEDKTVGLLGVAFKGDSDDTRDSLALRMKTLLELECRRVLCTDPFVRAAWLRPLEEVLREADVLVVGAPHSAYRALRPAQPTLDPWNLLGRGGLLT